MQRSALNLGFCARLAQGLFLGLSVLVTAWLISGTAALAQFQIGIERGGNISGDEQRSLRKQDRREERTRREHPIGPRLGIELNVGEIRPAYCYTYKFGGVVTCKKRSLDGETCQGDCVLSGDGTPIGPAPPSHKMAPGVSYRCNCGG